MINMIQLAVILLITAWASALEVTFRRFATTDCLDEHHINKDTHLNNPHCKTFDEDEPVFRSFMAIPEDNKDEIFTLNCSATVYSDKSCMGNSFSLGDMKTYAGQCVNTPVEARSVYIYCSERTAAVPVPSRPFSETTTLVLVPHATPTPGHYLEKRSDESRSDSPGHWLCERDVTAWMHEGDCCVDYGLRCD